MEDTALENAIEWLVQTVLASLLIGSQLVEWICQVGLGNDIDRLKSEVEEVEKVVSAMKKRETRSKRLAESIVPLKELLYDADNVVDGLDYWRLHDELGEADGPLVERSGEEAAGYAAPLFGSNIPVSTWNKDEFSNRIHHITCQLKDKRENVRFILNILRKSDILNDMILDAKANPVNLPVSLLQDITENFAIERKIGQGGFGEVYKGVLQNGSVAVKKLLNSLTIEDELFYREATFLMSVKHKNIVRFLGYCANTEQQAMKVDGPGKCGKYIYPEIRDRLLCFEYASEGSLEVHLTDELNGLEWHTRYEIIKGICAGLQYLHKEKDIVHMDLKPGNILLDHLMVPKITDFGISKYLDGISQAVTKGRLVTLGYCAPEYIYHGQVSFKCDIFSLGVIIKDIVTGRKEEPDTKNVLRRWRYRWNRSNKYPPLGYQQVTKCIEIAKRCMSFDLKTRPCISEIVDGLNEIECANEHNNNASESTFDQIRPFHWELLEIDPLELHFPFVPNKEIPCSLKLTNPRDDHIAFDIGTLSRSGYSIEPNTGIVLPQSKSDIIVTLQAQQRAPDDMMCKDEFIVRCAILNDGLPTEKINDAVFDENLGKVVDVVTLTVAFKCIIIA